MNNPKLAKLILHLIDAAVILHSMLIEFCEAEKEE